MTKVEVSVHHLMELVWMARRYVNGRSTYAPHIFNGIYEALRDDHPELFENEPLDTTIQYFPYAQDGMFNPDTGDFDARPEATLLRKEKLQDAVEDQKSPHGCNHPNHN